MNTTTKNYLISFFSIVLLSVNAKAITYTTMNNGTWNDIVNVWSTDGGVTPCGCTPGTPIGLNNIVVNHSVTATTNLVFNAGTVTVNPSGAILGGNNINTWSTTIDIHGYLDIAKWAQGTASNVTLHPSAIITASGKLSVVDGLLNLNGALINAGGFEIAGPGALTLINSSRFFNTSGNGINNGTINIDATSCLSTNGNFRNNASGVFNGTGAINSGGNIQNNGTFSINVAWCANGTGLGMPTAEDCPTATTICGAITLPVELSKFTAEAIDKDYIQLEWTTLSENNSSHFLIMSSKDGQNWKEIGSVNAAGNSVETIDYSFEDYNVTYGNTYYKLVQFDIDNREFESDVVAVYVEGEEIEIGMYPNPIRNNNTLTISNLEESTGTIGIYNMNGQLIDSLDIDGSMTSAQLIINNLQPGIYLVNVHQLGSIKTKRLVITE